MPTISCACRSIRFAPQPNSSKKRRAVKACFVIAADPTHKTLSTITKNRLSDSESSAFAYRNKTEALEILLLKNAARSFSLKQPQLGELCEVLHNT